MGTGFSSRTVAGAEVADTGAVDCFAAVASGFDGVADDAEGNRDDDVIADFASKDCIFVSA